MCGGGELCVPLTRVQIKASFDTLSSLHVRGRAMNLHALLSEACAAVRRVKNSRTHFKKSEHRFYRRWFYVWVTPLFCFGPGVGVLAAVYLYGDSSHYAYVVGSRLKKAATLVGTGTLPPHVLSRLPLAHLHCTALRRSKP